MDEELQEIRDAIDSVPHMPRDDPIRIPFCEWVKIRHDPNFLRYSEPDPTKIDMWMGIPVYRS